MGTYHPRRRRILRLIALLITGRQLRYRLLRTLLNLWIGRLKRLDARLEYDLWIASLWLQRATGVVLSTFTKCIGLVSAIPISFFVLRFADKVDQNLVSQQETILLSVGAIIATMYTLVASLSIIPIQRAAEAYTPTMVRVFRRDRVLGFLLAAFSVACIITTAAAAPVFGLQKHTALLVALLSLAVSLDMIRLYQRHIADMLNPTKALAKLRSIALQLLNQQLSRSKKTVELSSRLAPTRYEPNQRRILGGLFIGQLSLFSERALSVLADISEIGLRAISKREISTAQHAIISISSVVSDFMLGRQGSVIRFPDYDTGLLVSRTNLDDFSAKSYELLLNLGKQAVQEDFESVVVTAIEQLAGISALLSQAPARSRDPSESPFTFAPLFHLQELVKSALERKMNTAGLRASDAVQIVCLRSRPQIRSTALHQPALSVLTNVIASFLAQKQITLSSEAMKRWNGILLDAVGRDHFEIRHILSISLPQFVAFAQFAIAIGDTPEVVFGLGLNLPPYATLERGSISSLIDLALRNAFKAYQRKTGTYAWQALDELIEHCDKIASIDFRRSFLRYHVLQTLYSAAIHMLAVIGQFVLHFRTELDMHMRRIMQDILTCSRSSGDIISDQSQLGASMIASISIEACEVDAGDFSSFGIDLLHDLATAERTKAHGSPWIVSQILKFFEPMRRVFEKRKLEEQSGRCAKIQAVIRDEFGPEVSEDLGFRLGDMFEDDIEPRYHDLASTSYRNAMNSEKDKSSL